MDSPKVQLYGTDWCPKSAALRNFMQSRWLEFDDFNVETDLNADARIRALYDGELKFPTVMVGTDFIKNPKVPELIDFLKKHNIDH